MRNRLAVCRRKQRFVDAAAAALAATGGPFVLRPYRCERCRCYHLTSRRKGKRIARPTT